MNRNFTHFGHCFIACLLLSLVSVNGFCKSLYFPSNQNQSAGDPSEYSVFEAHVLKNYTVSINWSKQNTTSESYFEVERSFDQQEFKTVALLMVPEAEFGFDGNFKFKDNSKDLAGKSKAWYRIKEVAADGKFEYSAVKLVQLNPTSTVVTVFPNPFINSLNVKFFNRAEGKAAIKVLNFNGDVILTKEASVVKGNNIIQVDELADASNGIYIVEISMNGTVTERLKVIKK